MLKLNEKLSELGLQPGQIYKDSFPFYRSFADALRDLPANYKIALLDALMDYGLEMKEPDFGGDAVLSALWVQMAAQLDAVWVRTLNGYKGKDYGVQGGAPAGNQNASKERTTPKQPQNNPKTTPNININVNANENVNVNANEKENEKEKVNVANAETATPPTAEAVSLYFSSIGLTDAEASKFYSQYESRGWTDKDGRKVVNWKAIADYWAKMKRPASTQTDSRVSIPTGNHDADNGLFGYANSGERRKNTPQK